MKEYLKQLSGDIKVLLLLLVFIAGFIIYNSEYLFSNSTMKSVKLIEVNNTKRVQSTIKF